MIVPADLVGMKERKRLETKLGAVQKDQCCPENEIHLKGGRGGV